MPPWLSAALVGVQAATSVGEGLAHLWTSIHNEMSHGSGATAPAAITGALVEHAGAIEDAVKANTVAAPMTAPTSEPEPAAPSSSSETASDNSAEELNKEEFQTLTTPSA